MQVLVLLFALATPTYAAGPKLNGPLDVEADQLEVNQDSGAATFKGNVRVTQGDVALGADQIMVTYGKAKQQAGPFGQQVDHVTATGHVTLVYANNTATGNQADYVTATGLVTMKDNVTLTRDANTLKGEALELDLNTGNVRLKGQPGQRVRAHFVPGKEAKQ